MKIEDIKRQLNLINDDTMDVVIDSKYNLELVGFSIVGDKFVIRTCDTKRAVLEHATLETVVRDWYKKAYPYDLEWYNLMEDLTFEDLFFECMSGASYYDTMCGDEIQKKRILAELAEVYKTEEKAEYILEWK